jgi:hypothetical protein
MEHRVYRGRTRHFQFVGDGADLRQHLVRPESSGTAASGALAEPGTPACTVGASGRRGRRH